MKAPTRILLFGLVLVLQANACLYAQWKNVGPKLLGSTREGRGGSINESNGIIWAAFREVWCSLDSGKTWLNRTPPGIKRSGNWVVDVNFLDSNNGVLSDGTTLYKTRDQGKTWDTVSFHFYYFSCFSFFGDTSRIISAGTGDVKISYDGGQSWYDIILSGSWDPMVRVVGNGIAYIISGDNSQSDHFASLYFTTDYGVTWIAQAGKINSDNYSFAVDPCDPNTVYSVNENTVWGLQFDGKANFYVTHDKGISWDTVSSHPLDIDTILDTVIPGLRVDTNIFLDDTEGYYYTGAISVVPNAIFVQTFADGIQRSTDQGRTWKSIGGPNNTFDTRLVAAVDKNIIFAVDTQGSVWATFNSGGDSLTAFSSSTIHFSSLRIINDSLNITIHLPIYSRHPSVMSNLDMIMHYPTYSLKYLNGVAYNGKSIDVAGSQWAGRAALHFDAADLNAAPDSLLGYANFLWSSYEYNCSDILFDSISMQTAVSPCPEGIINAEPFKGIIGSSKTCGVSVVEDNSVNTASVFTFSPNPAGDYGIISSQSYYGTITARLYDISGSFVNSFDGTVSPGAPLKLTLRDLASGVYHLSIRGQGVQYELSFVHERE